MSDKYPTETQIIDLNLYLSRKLSFKTKELQC